MNILLYIKQAFSAIKSNKLRSFLSTLGIIIGILSFVIMLAIGEGTKRQILEGFSKEGNLITVRGGGGFGGFFGEEKKKTGKNIMTKEILEEIPKKVPNVSMVTGKYSYVDVPIIYKAKNIGYGVEPIDSNYFEAKKVKKILGTYFGNDDFENDRKIAIIGYSLVKKYFGDENPIGKSLSIGGEAFFVSGVLEEKGWDFDRQIFVPSSTAKKYFGKASLEEMLVYSKNEEVLETVKANLKYFLFKKSFVEDFSEVSFNINTNKEILKQMSEFVNSFTYFLVFIGAISLVVGGIGIMNIMLVSVTERTREIGIRKAIGATNFTIMLQFLIESIILTLIGSLIAILLSYGLAEIISKYAPKDLSLENIYIDTKILIIAISVSITMGIIFGIMPAYKAARLKTINALYFE